MRIATLAGDKKIPTPRNFARARHTVQLQRLRTVYLMTVHLRYAPGVIPLRGGTPPGLGFFGGDPQGPHQ